MITDDSKDKIIFLVVGWLLGIIASIITLVIKDYWEQRRLKRKTFTQVFLILEDIFISLEIAPVWREAGGIESIYGLLDIDESWRLKIPPPPPKLPDNFDTVLQNIAEFETSRGKTEITKKLQSLQKRLNFLQGIHAGLSLQAENGLAISERALSAYNDFLPEIKEQIQDLFRIGIFREQLSFFKRLKSKLKKIFKPKNKTENSNP